MTMWSWSWTVSIRICVDWARGALFPGDGGRGGIEVRIALPIFVAVAAQSSSVRGRPTGRVTRHRRLADPHDGAAIRGNAGFVVGGNGTDHHETGGLEDRNGAKAGKTVVGGDAVRRRDPDG